MKFGINILLRLRRKPQRAVFNRLHGIVKYESEHIVLAVEGISYRLQNEHLKVGMRLVLVGLTSKQHIELQVKCVKQFRSKRDISRSNLT